MYEYRVTKHRVIDGDTVEVTLDLGFSIEHTVTVRLLGVDTPERNDQQWEKAKIFTSQWMTDEQHIVLRTFKDRTGKYGRYLGDFIGTHNTLAGVLLEEGLAKPM